MKIIANKYSEAVIMKTLREWTELTQEEFGKNINLSKSTVQGYERNIRNYNFSTLMKICKKYGFTVTIEKK